MCGQLAVLALNPPKGSFVSLTDACAAGCCCLAVQVGGPVPSTAVVYAAPSSTVVGAAPSSTVVGAAPSSTVVGAAPSSTVAEVVEQVRQFNALLTASSGHIVQFDAAPHSAVPAVR
jgi:hypothetical protein